MNLEQETICGYEVSSKMKRVWTMELNMVKRFVEARCSAQCVTKVSSPGTTTLTWLCHARTSTSSWRWDRHRLRSRCFSRHPSPNNRVSSVPMSRSGTNEAQRHQRLNIGKASTAACSSMCSALTRFPMVIGRDSGMRDG